MSKFAVEVEHLSKSYLIGHNSLQSERYTALRDVVAQGARNMVRKSLDMVRGNALVHGDEIEEFWSLDDISFSVKPGERVGIIGRNGAGKSTLLKILSRITPPTRGSVKLSGRVASLLEVGTGFHPELTGRENIFLNGAILGMSKAEIRRNFDAIVEFAEVEKILDTPVKRYSSGMYVRLAFSVAAHLESDILIVDEVLAVGDAGFQRKCIGKMESVSGEGRTILFVSHNMGAIAELCTRAMLLNKGRKTIEGSTVKVIEAYMGHTAGGILKIGDRDNFPIFVTEIVMRDSVGNISSTIPMGENAEIEIHYRVTEPQFGVTMAMLLTRLGSPLLYSYENDLADELEHRRDVGDYIARLTLPLSRFKEGQYSVEAKIGVGQTNMTDENAVLVFEVCNHSFDTTHKSFRSDRPGHLYWPLTWKTSWLPVNNE
jgi:lipopolysaccharide transport system ATP-binding protein